MVFGKQCRASQLQRLHVVCMKTLKVQNIIVPIDFSKMSVQAIQIAKQLARRFGASIHLAHVRQSNYAADFVAPAFHDLRAGWRTNRARRAQEGGK